MFSANDKENLNKVSNQKSTVINKMSDFKSSSKSNGSFGRLLTDATNQVRTDYDKSVAISFTVDEAISAMEDWVRENKDLELAKKVAVQLEEESKEHEKVLIKESEAEALKIAIEETRRIKLLAKEKELKEKNDLEYAKALYEAEEKDAKLASKILEEDEKLARQLSSSEDFKVDFKSDCKHSDSDSDEGDNEDDKGSRGSSSKDANDLSDGEENNDDCMESNDDQIIKEAISRFFQLDMDQNLAFQTQHQLNHELEKESSKQELLDYKISRRLAIKTEREAHRLKKFHDMQQSFDKCQRDYKSICKLWYEAQAEVESVCQAVCITILLPNILDLQVKVASGGKKVVIKAKRLVKDDETLHSNTENSTFTAEFKLQGENIKMDNSQISHDYSSDSGLLHIYIEGVLLDDSLPSYSDKSEFKSESSSDKQVRVLDKLKSGFLRIFGK